MFRLTSRLFSPEPWLAELIGSRIDVSIGGDARAAIEQLSHAFGPECRCSRAELVEAAWARESLASTASAGGIAVPRARVGGPIRPVAALGIASGSPIRFGDGPGCRLVVLVVTPLADPASGLATVSRVVRELGNARLRRALRLSRTVDAARLALGGSASGP